MGILRRLFGNAIAAIYFIFPMLFVILFLLFMPLFFLQQVNNIRASGFAGMDMTKMFISIFGLFIGVSLLIPALRKMYKVLPWLYSFIKILFINFIIFNIGISILNMGYQIQNETRHKIFLILMIVQIVVCRIAMCIYFKLKPANYMEGR